MSQAATSLFTKDEELKWLRKTMDDAISMFSHCFQKNEDASSETGYVIQIPIELNDFSITITVHKTRNSHMMWKNLIMVPMVDQLTELKDENRIKSLCEIIVDRIGKEAIPFMEDFFYSFLLPVSDLAPFYCELDRQLSNMDGKERSREDCTAMYVTKKLYTQSIVGSSREVIYPECVSRIEFLDANKPGYGYQVRCYNETHKLSYDDEPKEVDFEYYMDCQFVIPPISSDNENEHFVERLNVFDKQELPVASCAMYYDRKLQSCFLNDVTTRPHVRRFGIARTMTKLMMERAFFSFPNIDSVTLTAVGTAKEIYGSKFGFECCGKVCYINCYKAF